MPKTILIVEDHDDVRRALQDWLAVEFPRCRVIGAACGEEAIALSRIESPCLVVMDVRLPGMTGIETTRHIKTILPSTQIVMLTIQTGDAYRADAKAAGASAYVTKQTMHAELVPTLSALLANAAPDDQKEVSMISTQVLSQVDLFAGLSERLLTSIGGLCEEISCVEGEMLFRESEEAKRLYFLLEGRVALQVQLSSRLENLTVTVIDSPGQGIGWSGIIPPHYYTASALCQIDCHLVAINGQELMRLLEQEPARGFVVMQRVVELISRRLRDSRAALQPIEATSRWRY